VVGLFIIHSLALIITSSPSPSRPRFSALSTGNLRKHITTHALAACTKSYRDLQHHTTRSTTQQHRQLWQQRCTALSPTPAPWKQASSKTNGHQDSRAFKTTSGTCFDHPSLAQSAALQSLHPNTIPSSMTGQKSRLYRFQYGTRLSLMYSPIRPKRCQQLLFHPRRWICRRGLMCLAYCFPLSAITNPRCITFAPPMRSTTRISVTLRSRC